MKPSMYEFLHAYMHNLYEALVTKELSTSDLMIDCSCCPFKAQCAAACEAGCELNCTEFICAQLSDGSDYKA